MKTFLILLAAALGGYYYYVRAGDRENPAEITTPSYAEMRVKLEIPGRDIDMVLFGKMVDENDCRLRTEKIWQKLVENCNACKLNVVDCKPQLAPRYAMLFDDTPISVTYMSLARGSPLEREGRMVFWGVTVDESRALCEITRAKIQERHQGAVTCVRNRQS
ncbi:MAG TPA: hypothetical protein VMB75_09120 [Rhodocyclaceae bacterium]|nr:hypothetical protein [Rhodocyclaceae bacterium]